MITVGIDPGLSGAVGVLRDGKFLAVESLPTVVKGSGAVKLEINPAALSTWLRDNVPVGEGLAVALERVNAMPGQGVSSVFSLGDSFGSIRATVAVMRLELTYVAPQTWKKRFNLTSDKETCRAYASRLFPEAPLRLKKDADKAEALLIARWLYEERFG